jgi:DNA-binding SARP family transcriptional activator
MQQPALLGVRLLAGLEVTRLDGTVVPARAWRTGKTMDLLRMLALSNGRPVRVTRLTETLWPGVSEERARGSLRTAGSHIRHATQVNCIVRHPEGLVLTGAWVDVVEFLELARQAHRSAREGSHDRVLTLARSAEELYVDDLHAHDDESDWAKTEREHLRRARYGLLCDAAAAALQVEAFADALDFSTTAVEIDPRSETAQRALMSAYAGLGDISAALRTFETYRARLAEELGADPSLQTRDLHLRILRGSER